MSSSPPEPMHCISRLIGLFMCFFNPCRWLVLFEFSVLGVPAYLDSESSPNRRSLIVAAAKAWCKSFGLDFLQLTAHIYSGQAKESDFISWLGCGGDEFVSNSGPCRLIASCYPPRLVRKMLPSIVHRLSSLFFFFFLYHLLGT